MEENILRDILSGMFIVSTNSSACIVDTALQVSSSSKPLVSVCINKNNYTNEMIKKNKKFIISILDINTKGEVIKTFGFTSSRDIDKFKYFDYFEIDGIKVLKDTIGYIVLELVNVIDCETHDIFIGRVVDSKRLSNQYPMSYRYYQENKNDILNIETKTSYVCEVCGYVHEGELSDDFICPICGMGKEAFKKSS